MLSAGNGLVVDLGDLEKFEQYVTQADLERDPFAVALFQLMTIDDDPRLLQRLGQTLVQHAGPMINVAYLGRNRFAMVSRTMDTPHQWVAPVATALRSTLDRWIEQTHGSTPANGNLVDGVDISDLVDGPSLVVGAASGLSRQVWLNAELALARAIQRRLPFAEFSSDAEAPTRRAGQDPTIDIATAADDNRLTTLAHRLEPVGRPEPEWYWLRLVPSLRLRDGAISPIDLDTLALRERALLEVWLANQIGDLFGQTSEQLRVSIPVTGEAARSRSFAHRIFPLIERHRIPPTRLVLEIDGRALRRESLEPSETDGGERIPPIRRFILDATSMDVAVAITNFDGSWYAWRNIAELPIDYVKPPVDLLLHAGLGDEGAIRVLVSLGSDADARGIELIVPNGECDLSDEALSQLGFSYYESQSGPVEDSAAADTFKH